MHVTFTDGARSKIREYLEAAPNQPQSVRKGKRAARSDG